MLSLSSVAILAQGQIPSTNQRRCCRVLARIAFGSMSSGQPSDVGHIVNELQQINALKLSREKLRAGSFAPTEERIVAALANKISNIACLDTAGSNVVVDAIVATNLHQSHKDILAEAVDAKLDSKLSAPHISKTGAIQQQHCYGAPEYCPVSITDMLQNNRLSIATKVTGLTEFMVIQLGIVHPHEQTYKWWLAMLVRLHFNVSWPTYKTIHNLLCDMKQSADVARTKLASNGGYPFPLMCYYPKTPSDLSHPVFKHAYADNDPPTVIVIERYIQTANHHIPLRSNSKLLINEEKAVAAARSTGSPASALPIGDGSLPCDFVNGSSPHWVKILASFASRCGTYAGDRDDDHRDRAANSMRPRNAIQPRLEAARPSSSPILAITDGDHADLDRDGTIPNDVHHPAILATPQMQHRPSIPGTPPAPCAPASDIAKPDDNRTCTDIIAASVTQRSIATYEKEAMERLTKRDTRKKIEANAKAKAKAAAKRSAAQKAKEEAAAAKTAEKVAAVAAKAAASCATKTPGAVAVVAKKPASSLMQRPAAALLKRPAAACPYDFSPQYKKLKADDIVWTPADKQSKKGTYQCRWYDRVKRHMKLNDTLSSEEQDLERKRVLALAGTVWDANQ